MVAKVLPLKLAERSEPMTLPAQVCRLIEIHLPPMVLLPKSGGCGRGPSAGGFVERVLGLAQGPAFGGGHELPVRTIQATVFSRRCLRLRLIFWSVPHALALEMSLTRDGIHRPSGKPVLNLQTRPAPRSGVICVALPSRNKSTTHVSPLTRHNHGARSHISIWPVTAAEISADQRSFLGLAAILMFSLLLPPPKHCGLFLLPPLFIAWPMR